MDPATLAIGVVSGLAGYGARVTYRAIKARAEVRRAEVDQQGLSERVRSLPPGSRLSERSADREVEITVGGAADHVGKR
ncbi:hypothetical protein ACFWCB_15880 [Streptomyces sp. NPDC060048]|uniref:hypothetical protein n=1 Tax=unclassified Streptomyces TaxID=2593676 RepID=UPI0036CE139C